MWVGTNIRKDGTDTSTDNAKALIIYQIFRAQGQNAQDSGC
jgi:hypothetical protein